jgi:hypothetical protein
MQPSNFQFIGMTRPKLAPGDIFAMQLYTGDGSLGA